MNLVGRQRVRRLRLAVDFCAMEFDQKTKELGQAHDAVDRLRELQQTLGRREAIRTKLLDWFVRATVLALLVAIVVYAFWMI